ncbi:hypothetical protein ACH5RR_002855 [Cinchona calisaya]|uniref:Uncharacterized protein n=1 Tax=Cinchona calisaya TaxID=153742 RepID=A0ABD3ATR5_9GENT
MQGAPIKAKSQALQNHNPSANLQPSASYKADPSGISTRDKTDIPTYNAVQKKVIEPAPNEPVSILDDLQIALYFQPRDDHHRKFRISKVARGSFPQVMINWQLAAHMVKNDTVSLPVALITWSLWLARYQFLYHAAAPSSSRAIKIVIELLSNLSFVSPLKSTPFIGLLAQNLLAPIQLSQAKQPRVVAVTWSRDFLE